MGPSEDPPTREKNQGRVERRGRAGKPTRRPRTRACLLKGCGRRFRPHHPRARYCSEQCREGARRWRAWKRRQRYRQTENGKQKRRAQCRRYRMRQARTRKTHPAPGEPREGHSMKIFLTPPATGPAAMRSSRALGVRRGNAFVATPAGGLWSGFGSGNDSGKNHAESAQARPRVSGGGDLGGRKPGRDSPDILPGLSRSA